MASTMDIVFCVDCSLSMSFHLKALHQCMRSILKQMTKLRHGRVQMALNKFQSHGDEWSTYTYPFTSSINTFEQWIPAGPLTGDNSDEKKAIVDALGECLSLDWRSNINNEQNHEKLVILFTDGSPCNLLSSKCSCDSPDLWKMGDKFADQNITLIVLGIEPTVICDAFYCALARKTGGEYFPFINGARVLPNLMLESMEGKYTITRLLARLDAYMDIEQDSLYSYSAALKWADDMYKNCDTLADIRKLFYPYLDRMNDRLNNQVQVKNNDPEPDVHPGSPPSSTNFMVPRSPPLRIIIPESPIPYDQVYQSRLPTVTLSINSNLSSPVHLQGSTNSLDLGLDNAIDDDINFINNNPSFNSLTINRNYFYHRSASDLELFASTPVTDDEGYRTRLATAASADTSFTYLASSPSHSAPIDADLADDTDYDDVF